MATCDGSVGFILVFPALRYEPKGLTNYSNEKFAEALKCAASLMVQKTCLLRHTENVSLMMSQNGFLKKH